MVFIIGRGIFMDEKKVSKSNVEYINKKGKKINQKKKSSNDRVVVKADKDTVRSIAWVVALFVTLFVVLFALPYISNFR